MANRKRALVVFGSVITLAAGMTTPAFAETLSAETVTGTSLGEQDLLDESAWQNLATTDVDVYSNIRSGPSIDSDLKGVLLPGSIVEVTGTEGDWTAVHSDSLDGYIRSDLLVFGDAARESYFKTYGISGDVCAPVLNVRDGASLENDIVGYVTSGEQIAVKGCDNGWYQISFEGSNAYVSADYVEEAQDSTIHTAMTVEEYHTYLIEKANEEAAQQAAAAQAAADQAAAAQAAADQTAAAQAAADQTAASQTAADTSASATQTSSAMTVSDSDLNLLAAIIHCEAGGESRDGKVAVGAVVLNRVRSGSFPNTISEVIYQSGQFTPASSGALDAALANGPDADCLEAAQAALNGENPIGDCLYFHAGSGDGIVIGNQTFY